MHRGLRWRSLKERDYLTEIGVDGKLILKWIVKEQGGKLLNGLMQLMAETSDEFLLTF